MARFKLVLEYAGTRYRGWQIQKNARTVQGEIHRAVAEVTGARDFEIYGSGRTDAGVHALGQVAHLEVETRLRPEVLETKLNDVLPSDIHILSLARAPARFHARHHALGRSYLYQISRRRTAFGKPYVWWIRDELSFSAMRSAARLFHGMQDYRSFTDAKTEDGSTRVLIDAVSVAESDALILLRIVGSHFLWKMVRRMVGVLAEVGRGAMPESEIERLLQTDSRVPAALTAPPSGLFLERVFYEGDARDWPLLPAFPVTGTS
jgi:tRNA pseudouridine38-40 synthase